MESDVSPDCSGSALGGKMAGFTKLHSSLTASSIWNEPDEVRIVWVTMLAMADSDGNVKASIVGLAHLARKTIAETQKAIDVLLAPDPYSGRKELEGRRVTPIDGGWHLVTHEFYRELGMSEGQKERAREKTRERVKRYRALHGVTSASASLSEKEGMQGEIPSALKTPDFIKAWDEWGEYRKQAKLKAYTPIGAKKQLTILSRLGPARAIAAIENSIANAYQGIFQPKPDFNGKRPPGSGNRSSDFKL